MYYRRHENLEIGDKLQVRGIHYGIYVGPRGSRGENVVHNAKGAGVQFVHLSEFAGGEPVWIVARVPSSWYAREIVAQRAVGLVGMQYDLINFNCEHFVNLVQTGKATSPLVALGAVVGTICLAWAASRA